MRKYAVIKIPGGKEIKFEAGQYTAFENLVNAINIAIHDPHTPLFFNDGGAWDILMEELNETKGYHTYGVIKVYIPEDTHPSEYKKIARENIASLKIGVVELIEKTYTVQLLRIGTYVESVPSNGHKYDTDGNLKPGYKD